jgi:hypothetical protein
VKWVEPAASKDDDGGAHEGGSVIDKGLCDLWTISDLPIAVEYCLTNGWIRTWLRRLLQTSVDSNDREYISWKLLDHDMIEPSSLASESVGEPNNLPVPQPVASIPRDGRHLERTISEISGEQGQVFAHGLILALIGREHLNMPLTIYGCKVEGQNSWSVKNPKTSAATITPDVHVGNRHVMIVHQHMEAILTTK